MTIYVFTGPTLSAAEASEVLPAVYLPPAAQGDVLRAARRAPTAIGIIDGYFELIPAVWHKEILWAMSQGIHVFGASSMGALRAAELATFGMVGVGEIFDAFLRGELEDDDEVAVVHAPASEGYRPLSTAMVNVRATLAAAVREGAIVEDTARALERIAKEMFYADRAYPAILRRAVAEGVPAAEIEAARAFFKTGQVNQKRLDALSMLRAIGEHVATAPGPKRVTYRFEHTDAWHTALRQSGSLGAETDHAGAVLAGDVADELRLEGRDAWARATQGALARYLGLVESRWQGATVAESEVESALGAYCREHGLTDEEGVERWLARNHMTRAQMRRLMEDEARLRWVEWSSRGEVEHHLPDHLRAVGRYGALVERARDKQLVLLAHGLENPELADAGMSREELLSWYFGERLGTASPDDIEAHARALGADDESAFERMLLRERCYLMKLEAAEPD